MAQVTRCLMALVTEYSHIGSWLEKSSHAWAGTKTRHWKRGPLKWRYELARAESEDEDCHYTAKWSKNVVPYTGVTHSWVMYLVEQID